MMFVETAKRLSALRQERQSYQRNLEQAARNVHSDQKTLQLIREWIRQTDNEITRLSNLIKNS